MILSVLTFSGYVAVQVPQYASTMDTDDAVQQNVRDCDDLGAEVPVEEQLG